MYFYDIEDYYNPLDVNPNEWKNYGFVDTMLGCAGGPMSTDWEDYFGTARETGNAFFKAVNQWYLASSSVGYTESMDVTSDGKSIAEIKLVHIKKRDDIDEDGEDFRD